MLLLDTQSVTEKYLTMGILQDLVKKLHCNLVTNQPGTFCHLLEDSSTYWTIHIAMRFCCVNTCCLLTAIFIIFFYVGITVLLFWRSYTKMHDSSQVMTFFRKSGSLLVVSSKLCVTLAQDSFCSCNSNHGMNFAGTHFKMFHQKLQNTSLRIPRSSSNSQLSAIDFSVLQHKCIQHFLSSITFSTCITFKRYAAMFKAFEL